MNKVLWTLISTLPLLACGAEMGSQEDIDQFEAEMTLDDPRPAPPSLTDTFIDFDISTAVHPLSGPDLSVPLTDGQVVGDTYAEDGVTFSCVVCPDGKAYARHSNSRATNVVSSLGRKSSSASFFDAKSGAVVATFRQPRSWVSIEATAVPPPEYKGKLLLRPFLEAYDANDQLVARAYFQGDPARGQTETLRVSTASANIHHVRFSSQYAKTMTRVFGEFDNLRYSDEPM